MISVSSIHNLKPIEVGGTISRDGFIYQDHVVVSLLLEMLDNNNLEEVWCETHDDITLIWRGDIGQEVEFVQVKNLSLKSFWSTAKLCQREKTNINKEGTGSSLLEKSFAHDRCDEPCKFRIVTSLPANQSLKVLTLPFTSPIRSKESDEFKELVAEVKKRLGDPISPNKHEISYWIENSRWQVSSEREIIAQNKAHLLKIISNKGIHLTGNAIEENVYPKILNLAQEAAAAIWEHNADAKKIHRKDFITWFDSVLNHEQYFLSTGAGEKLKEKMEKAKISSDYILTAQDERRRYRQERLAPKYLEINDLDLMEGEILSELKGLRLKLDSGELPDGTMFLKKCQDKLREIQLNIQLKSKPPMYFLDGCMYDITDRCAHRYHREAK
jgi:hypothetical protein